MGSLKYLQLVGTGVAGAALGVPDARLVFDAPATEGLRGNPFKILTA